MSFINRMFGNNAGNSASAANRTAAAGSAAAGSAQATNGNAKPASGSSPLAPGFSLDDHKSDTNQVRSASLWLGKNFKACMMEARAPGQTSQPRFHGYGTHKPMDMSITKELPGGRLDLILGLNVSGHDLKSRGDKDTALANRAKDNTYHVHVTDDHGRDEWLKDIPANGDLSTLQGVSIQNMKPGKTVVEAWPEGSAAVGGYVEGRRLEIDYKPRKAYAESGFDR